MVCGDVAAVFSTFVHNFPEGTLQEHWMEQVLYFLIHK
jgi:hypothetical protein